jgi:hypothetical protein
VRICANFSTYLRRQPWSACSRNGAPARPHNVLGLDLHGAHLAGLCALAHVGLQLLLLVLELDALALELALRLLQRALVLAQPLGRRHALAERPLDDVHGGRVPWEQEGCGEEGCSRQETA